MNNDLIMKKNVKVGSSDITRPNLKYKTKSDGFYRAGNTNNHLVYSNKVKLNDTSEQNRNQFGGEINNDVTAAIETAKSEIDKLKNLNIDINDIKSKLTNLKTNKENLDTAYTETNLAGIARFKANENKATELTAAPLKVQLPENFNFEDYNFDKINESINGGSFNFAYKIKKYQSKSDDAYRAGDTNKFMFYSKKVKLYKTLEQNSNQYGGVVNPNVKTAISEAEAKFIALKVNVNISTDVNDKFINLKKYLDDKKNNYVETSKEIISKLKEQSAAATALNLSSDASDHEITNLIKSIKPDAPEGEIQEKKENN